MSSDSEAGAMVDTHEMTMVNADLDICRRLVFDPVDQSLIRVVKSPTGKQETLMQLQDLRGHVLTEVHGAIEMTISADRTLEGVIEDIDLRGHAHMIDELELLFRAPDPEHVSPAEEQRRKKSGLFEPNQLETELSETILISYLQPRGLRKRPISDVSALPAGSCLYFNNPLWQLKTVGALLKVPPRSLKELDLRNNQIADVGADLSRFELLVDLRLDGNRIKDIELHYLPRLQYLSLAFNQLTVLPELMGLPALQDLDLSDNKIGSRESGDGLDRKVCFGKITSKDVWRDLMRLWRALLLDIIQHLNSTPVIKK